MKYLSQSVPNVDKRMSPLYPDPQPILWRRARLFSPVSLNLALSHESKGTWRMCFPLTGNNRRYMRQQQVTKLTFIYLYILTNSANLIKDPYMQTLKFDLLQTSFAVRDHLINFALFTVVSFGAVVQLNTFLWQMWMAESRAKMVTLNLFGHFFLR